MAFLSNIGLLISLLCILLFHTILAEDKYSEEANKPQSIDPLDFPTSLRDLNKPFRMAALNVIWVKAKNRLTDVKLQSILSDLKIHDKEELAYKHLKADGKDPNNEEEARLRKKLIGILSTYGLLEHFKETEDPKLLEAHKALNDGRNYVARNVFNDSKLNQLWAKVEMLDITNEELQTLKEEFQHYQDKMTEYLNLLKDVEDGDTEIHENSLYHKPESSNEIQKEETSSNGRETIDYLKKATMLREQHEELKAHFAQLHKFMAENAYTREFKDPKVQKLWHMVLQSNFTPQAIIMLKEELHHFQAKLLKLRHYHTEAALEAARQGKGHEFEDMDPRIKKHKRTVQKIQADLEAKIMQGHSEL